LGVNLEELALRLWAAVATVLARAPGILDVALVQLENKTKLV
jgi:hypothetical protein